MRDESRSDSWPRLLWSAFAVLLDPEDREDFRRELAVGSLDVPSERRTNWIRRQLVRSALPVLLRRAQRLRRSWLDDAHHAYRALIGGRRTTLLTIATLSIGLATTVTVFGVLRAVLLAPLPFPDPDELHLLRAWQPVRSSDLRGISGPDFVDLTDALGPGWSLGAFDRVSATLTGTTPGPLKIDRAGTSAAALEIVGQYPIVGRWFTEQEERDGASVALVSEALWARLYARAPSVVGQGLQIDGVPHIIVGVMPESFTLPSPEVGVWTPLGDEIANLHRRAGVLDVLFRASPLDVERLIGLAAAEAARLESLYPETNAGRTVRVVALVDHLAGGDGRALRTLMAGAFGLLAIAFFNALGLVTTRIATRREELSVRLALGSPARRIRRQLLLEIAGASAASLVLALGLAQLGLSLARLLWPSDAFLIAPIRIDAAVVGFSLGATAALVGLASFAPRLTIRSTLGVRGSGAARVRSRALLTSGQLAVVIVLLGVATSVVGAYVAMADVDRGVHVDQLLVARVDLPADRYPTGMQRYPNWPEVQGLYTALETSLGEEASVLDVALAGSMPLQRATFRIGVGLQGTATNDTVEAAIQMVSHSWRSTVGAEMRQGRDLTIADGPEAEMVAIVNEAFARAFLDGASGALGTVRYLGANRRIVGVVSDQVPVPGVHAQPTVFAPISQTPSELISVVVRTRGAPQDALGTIRRVVAEVDPLLAVYDEEPLGYWVARRMSRPALNVGVVTYFGAAGLLVAAVGLFSFVAHLVATMRRVIAVRIALGANFLAIARLVLSAALVPVVLASFIGSAGLVLALPLVRTVLPQAPGPEVSSILVAGSIFATVALVAVIPSIIRAWRTDPVSALRG